MSDFLCQILGWQEHNVTPELALVQVHKWAKEGSSGDNLDAN